MDSLERKYLPAPKIAFRVIGDRVVIVHPLENRLITLNETGSEIWKRLDGRATCSIVEEVATLFDVKMKQLTSDAISFLDTMEQKRLVVQKE